MNIKIALKVTEVNKKTLINNINETGCNSKIAFTFQSEHWRLNSKRKVFDTARTIRPVILYYFPFLNEKLK